MSESDKKLGEVFSHAHTVADTTSQIAGYKRISSPLIKGVQYIAPVGAAKVAVVAGAVAPVVLPATIAVMGGILTYSVVRHFSSSRQEEK